MNEGQPHSPPGCSKVQPRVGTLQSMPGRTHQIGDFRCCPFVMLQFPAPSVIIKSTHQQACLSLYGMPTLPQANKPSFQELRILWQCHSARSVFA
jgi:hypothetical protein